MTKQEKLVTRTRGQGTQTVYATLRREILSMTLRPDSHLDEVRLSERFGMSRTPIREALLRLAADGLVTTLPNRNTVVAGIDYAALPHYFEALTLMYRVTTRGAAMRKGAEGMESILACQRAFVEAVDAQNALAMIEANREFHVAIAIRAGNPYFTSLFMRLLDEGRRIIRLYYSTFDDRLPRKYVDEHEEMIEAIRVSDVERADQLAKAHSKQIIGQIQEFIARDADKSMELTDF
ncbi:GntR family transcriptional regulator [Rhizobium sp. RCC_161_2]|uniref:GntR family transcriptional regulator n=1 Tax=Rhizobium sp. RCC_161_2 TaxID=3239219 RepID=UPI0035247028